MLIKIRLARRVKEFRTANAMTQEELAKAAGIQRETIVQIESGNSNPRLSTIEAIAYTLSIDISELLKQKEYGQTPETFS